MQCASYVLELLSHGGLRSYVFGGARRQQLPWAAVLWSLPTSPVGACILSDEFNLPRRLAKRHGGIGTWSMVRACDTTPSPHHPIPRNLPSFPTPLMERFWSWRTTQFSNWASYCFIGMHSSVADRVFLAGRSCRVEERMGGQINYREVQLYCHDQEIRRETTRQPHRVCQAEWWTPMGVGSPLQGSWLWRIPNERLGRPDTLSEYFEREGLPYEDWALQILVMTELFPIMDLVNTDRLAPAIKDVFKCKYLLSCRPPG